MIITFQIYIPGRRAGIRSGMMPGIAAAVLIGKRLEFPTGGDGSMSKKNLLTYEGLQNLETELQDLRTLQMQPILHLQVTVFRLDSMPEKFLTTLELQMK